ncbi:hypothetical protein PsAD5_03085 [Pseudovibrio sp. Ad5]|uniref:phosphoribosyltransferase-like protein n=1 Tax=Pseudovibrio sp. Ad5 TaxID=989436 RepID=UPI0007AE719A|nr:hypothetical protein [Pseudovibrio sp. Ad5]KZK93370.1 hypothetical protein PsAD5_03085 [Pseudovibrio sp. Ad5]
MIDSISKTETGKAWLRNFEVADRAKARTLLDSLQLINLDEVSESIHKLLDQLASERSGKRKAIAVYAEREFQEKRVFQTEQVKRSNGSIRERAIGKKGPPPIKPIRGGVRVGSEGIISSLIAQAVKKHTGVLINTPGPNRFRSDKSPISTIAIVTDFIGSGSRLTKMLDKFWNVRTVRSWHSTGLIDFVVIAAAATQDGMAAVSSHISRPDVRSNYTVPTLDSSKFEQHQMSWNSLLDKFAEQDPKDDYVRGFLDSAALILFSYGIPNNAPSILWKNTKQLKPLYVGNAPSDLRTLFWSGSKSEQVARAASERGYRLDALADVKERIILLVLQELRGRFSRKKVKELSERLSLPRADIMEALKVAYQRKLIEANGRLTDKGYNELKAQNINRERKIVVPTNEDPYYPITLRASKVLSSTHRSKGRS